MEIIILQDVFHNMQRKKYGLQIIIFNMPQLLAEENL